MAKGGVKNEGKGQFVKEQLKKDPRANAKKINEAWTAAGKTGKISVALVNKLRAALGLTGNLRKTKKKYSVRIAAAGKVASTDGRRSSAASDFERVEGELDRLLFKVMGIEGMEGVESVLRRARRELYRAYDHAE